MSSVFSKSSNEDAAIEPLSLIEHALSRVENVYCSHWRQQRIVLAFDKSRVAKLCPSSDDRLLWERAFVSRVLNWLLDKNITPCVTRHYASVECLPNTAFGRVLWRKMNCELKRLNKTATGKYTPFTSALSCLSPLQQTKLALSSATESVDASLLMTPENANQTNGRYEAVTGEKNNPERAVRLVGFVVERAPGIPLHNWAQKKHSVRQWVAVLFQLLYTIDTLRSVGVRHNDLHWDNIFVDSAGWKENLSFLVPTTNNKTLTFRVKETDPALRLIDFDKASVFNPLTSTTTAVPHSKTKSRNELPPKQWYVALADNPLLRHSLCTSYGMCNSDPNGKYDAHTVLCFLMRGVEQYSYAVPESIQEWVRHQAMPSGSRLHSTDFEASGGFLCRLGKPFCSTGRSYVPTDKEQMTTLDFLTQTNLFRPLLTTTSNSSSSIRGTGTESVSGKVFVHPQCVQA